MSVLYLIGNGFDLNCGMRTRYTDVYEKYVKTLSETETIMKFKDCISGSFDNWGDFEMAMAEYAKCFKTEEEFLECIRDFAEYMEKHLMTENNKIKKIIQDKNIQKSVIEEAGKSFASFYNGINHNVDMMMESRNVRYIKEIEVVSFNYTDAFDAVFYEYAASHGIRANEVTHIHGVLGDGPVMGVDKVEQIKAEFLLSRKGKRAFVKPIFNGQYDQHRVQDAQEKIKKANTICVYGMSLGDSDLSWRNEIIEWLRESTINQLFVYKYNFSDVQYRTVDEKMSIEDDAKEQLLNEWGIDSNDSIFEQIHIPCGKNIFNFGKVIEDVENKLFEEKINKGEKFISQHLNDTVAV